MKKQAKLIDPTTGAKQVVDGRPAFLHKLTATNPIVINHDKMTALCDKGLALEREVARLKREMRKAALELKTLQESQRLELESQFDTSKLPSAPQVSAKLIENKNGAIDSIAFVDQAPEHILKANELLDELLFD